MSGKSIIHRRPHIIDTKRICVSSKRQITIPQKYFEKLNIGDEVECLMTDSEIIIRPVRQDTEFAEEILKDLIARGFQGDQLLTEFKNYRAKIRPAIKRIIEEAKQAAEQFDGTDTMKEIFLDSED
ncbi:AbrB/MazE/SpoVT family DNA-binding domain-containing protein [Phosphitispora sp. TUW77]|uniref:AbrB/MazE/SpoVT family DNA-binding domain-containing protein n=1 Tax=Phosphitispora sp. TUW77 TaxID=3152361 RepID=UPI003AB850CF